MLDKTLLPFSLNPTGWWVILPYFGAVGGNSKAVSDGGTPSRRVPVIFPCPRPPNLPKGHSD